MKTNMKLFEEEDKKEAPPMKTQNKNKKKKKTTTTDQGKKSATVYKPTTMKKTRAILKERKRRIAESWTQNLRLVDKKQVTLKNITTTQEKKSVRVSKPSLPKPVTMKTKTTPSRVTKPVVIKSAVMYFSEPTVKACVTKPMSSTMKSIPPLKVRLHKTELKSVNDSSIEDVNGNKIKDLMSQRTVARLALDQMVPTVAFEDHLSYHRELEQLGCSFIQPQVHLLEAFSMLSRNNNFDF